MKLSTIFSFTTYRRTGVHRVELLDTDGIVLLQSDGKTQESALEALLDSIRHVFRERDTDPLFLDYRNDRFIIFFTPESWCYAPLKAWQGDEHVFGTHSTCSGYASRKTAERAVRMHLAQRNWQPGEREASIIAAWDTEGQQEFARWACWQDAYRKAIAQGMDSNAAHRYADQARFAA